MVGGIDLLGGQRLVPDTHFRDLAVEITVAGIRIADPEATGLAVRLVGMLHAEIHGRGTDVAAALLHTVEVYLHASRLECHGHMVPAAGIELEIRIGQVPRRSDLNLVGIHARIADTHQELTLDTHDRGDLVLERIAVDQRLEREGTHVGYGRGILPVGPSTVLGNTGHDVDQRGTLEDIVNTAGTRQHVDTRHRTDRHGQYIALVLVQQVHVDEPDRHGNARHASGLYPGLRLIELVELLGKQFHVLVVEGLAVVVEQFGSRGELDRNVLPDGLGDTGRDFALIGGIRSLDKHLVGEIRRRDEKFIVVMLPGQILVLAACQSDGGKSRDSNI